MTRLTGAAPDPIRLVVEVQRPGIAVPQPQAGGPSSGEWNRCSLYSSTGPVSRASIRSAPPTSTADSCCESPSSRTTAPWRSGRDIATVVAGRHSGVR